MVDDIDVRTVNVEVRDIGSGDIHVYHFYAGKSGSDLDAGSSGFCQGEVSIGIGDGVHGSLIGIGSSREIGSTDTDIGGLEQDTELCLDGKAIFQVEFNRILLYSTFCDLEV